MRRLALFVALIGAVTSSWAQGFSITRPKDGSVVRETVQIRIPKSSVGQNNFVSFWINGKFLEAVGFDDQDLVGNEYVYKLDTKGRKIPDGKLTITAKLYQDFGGEAGSKEMNSTTVDVTLDNSRSIKVPASGFKLRYDFRPGTQLIYNVEAKVTQASITETQKQLGGRASEEMIDTQKLRFLIACDNAYSTPNGKEGLLRVQLLPPAGKEYAYVDLTDSGTPTKYGADQMWPIYMRVNEVGREVFGNMPSYFGFEGGEASTLTDGLLIPFALPLLPDRGIKPGDPYPGSFLQVVPGLIENPKLNIFAGRVTAALPARGVLEGIEWEGGIPCAKLRNTIEVGQGETKTTLDSVFWFALDRRCMVKYLLTRTLETKVSAQEGGGGQGGGMMGPPRGGGGGMMGPPRGGGGGVAPGDGGDLFSQRGGGRGNGGMMGPPGAGGNRGGGRGGGAPVGAGSGGGTGGNGGGSGRSGGAEYVRVRQQFVFTLQK